MQFGLKNRLRLISLVPIVILFSIASYYVYDSFRVYKASEVLKNKLTQNEYLNEIIGNVARERGMSAMYLGNKEGNILKSLSKQRAIVDTKVSQYLSYTKDKDSANTQQNNNIEIVSNLYAKIKAARPLVDESKIEFNEMFIDIYSTAQIKLIKQLQQITKNKVDQEILELYSLYISMVNSKEASGVERGYISYVISRSTQLTEDDLNRWISIIGKADTLEYERINDDDIILKFDDLFKNEESQELFEDINTERTAIISVSNSGEYDISSGVWFTMLSEKINIISKAEKILLKEMDIKAQKVKENSLQVLIITFTVWVIAILLAVLGYLLSNEIANNIKNLEAVLKKVAQDTESKGKKIDLHTAEGTNQAYELLEQIIEQTKQDKLSAQEASEAKSMFLANMSHEIRTPLNGIVGFTELLKDSGLEEEQSEFVDIIEKSSENLLEIINNILDLSKIESNKLEIENIAFNPVIEFESAIEVYAVRAAEKHINLGCFIDPQLEAPLKGDPTKIKEVLINLLSNAVKFTNNAGSINVNIRKMASQTDGKTTIKFEVEDSGIGVSSEQKTKIFEAFSQADTSITRKYGGTGLGLTISSSFINLMGGTLDLTSAPAEGTTFFFTIELENVDIAHESSQNTFASLNTLILSDSLKIKQQDTYLREYLDYLGVKYTTFKNSSEISSLQKDTNYNLIIVDYDYIDNDSLEEISKLSQELIVLTKSNLMRKLEMQHFNIFKILYEPLHFSKIKHTLENISQHSNHLHTPKKKPFKKFNSSTSKFVANVLIAEDNIINQKLIQRTLEDLGLTITIANNGLEAFQKRKDNKFDMIFMDIQMPFLDGVEATQEILEWEKDYEQAHIPIVALTANALKGDRERFLSAGLDEYTTKPLVRSEIIHLLNQFLSEHIVENTEAIEITKPKETTLTSTKPYTADILLAKKSSFEGKLYAKILDSIDGLTYEIASSIDNFHTSLKNNSYHIVMFDKEYADLNIQECTSFIRKISDENNLDTKIILIDDTLEKNTSAHEQHVDEIIKNSVNKELLKSLFAKL